MPLLYQEKYDDSLCIGIWELLESEDYYFNSITLTEYDKELLSNAKCNRRRIELLSVRLLAKSLGLNIDIHYTNTGKPIIDKGNISISHCKQYAAIIFHKSKSVSIDIEKVNDIVLKGKHLVFTKSEIEFANNNLERLTTLWCCKECVVKLTNDLKVNYLTQINIHPFCKNSIIKCDYKNKIKHYKFYHSCINNHIIVWGIDDSYQLINIKK